MIKRRVQSQKSILDGGVNDFDYLLGEAIGLLRSPHDSSHLVDMTKPFERENYDDVDGCADDLGLSHMHL